MKTLIQFCLSFLLITFQNSLFAQSNKPLLAVADIDINEIMPNGLNYSYPDLVMMEMLKIQQYELLDRYDMNYLAKKEKIEIAGCFSRICLVDIGKALQVQKVLTGSILTVGDNLVITFRLLDVASGNIEKTHSVEYLKLPTELKMMVRITLQEMFGQPIDEEQKKKLTMRNDYDGSANNPYKLRLRSDGPRMGFTYFSGEIAGRLAESRSLGGYEAQPLMFQFGYQFEKQYLNEGNFQALFEFIPMMTGLDQGLFIPSVTIMNGLRNNKNGWEFAFGPTFSVVQEAKGFYAPGSERWTLRTQVDSLPDGVELISRLDSRGEPSIQTGFVFAAGKTFKSGKLNIPLNVYVIPNNKGLRFGVSVGFNAKDRYAYRP